jgi:GT2 family glycosyltransferase
VVDIDFLSELAKADDGDKSIGFAGPIIYYYNYGGRSDVVNVAGVDPIMPKGTFHRIGANGLDEGQYNAVRTVDCLEGSCLLMRRAMLDAIGLLDPEYFAY